jgi:hypothetical protein
MWAGTAQSEQRPDLSIEESWFDSKQRQDNSLFSTTARPALDQIQLPIQWVHGSLFKAPGPEFYR